MDTRYDYRMASAYYRGRAIREGNSQLDSFLLQKPLLDLTEDEMELIVSEGRKRDDKLYYFKRTHEEMARVHKVLGFLHSISFESLLDVGSGRGVFLLPFLNDFPWVQVHSVDILPHRVQLWKDIQCGGVEHLNPMLADITSMPMPEKSVDIISMLEVLEHIPNVEKAIESAVKITRRYLVISVPSKPDENPEHIHLLTKNRIIDLFSPYPFTRLHFDGVNGHLILYVSIPEGE